MSDKQQTALQQLIEWNNSKDRYSMITWIELDSKLKELLPIEKQQIIDAHCDGQSIEDTSGVSDAKQYFNDKFKTESNGK